MTVEIVQQRHGKNFKAAIEFNVFHVHIDSITSSKKFFEFIRIVSDHLAFLTSASFFRIAAMVISITYLGTFGLIPIGIFWLLHLIIGYRQ